MKPSPAVLTCAVLLAVSARADFVEVVVNVNPSGTGCAADFASAKAQVSAAKNDLVWWSFRNTCADQQDVTVCAPKNSPVKPCKGQPATTAIGTAFPLPGGSAVQPTTAAAICEVDFSAVIAKPCMAGKDCPVYHFYVVNRADPNQSCNHCPSAEPAKSGTKAETEEEAAHPRPCRRSYELAVETVP